MQRLVLIFFLCLSCFSFGQCKVIDLVDEFGDFSGKKALIIMNHDSILKIEKGGEEGAEYCISINSSEYIGGKGEFNKSKVKIKIDDLSPKIFNGFVLPNYDGKTVAFLLDKNEFYSLLKLLKKGKIMKVLIEKYNDATILERYDLTGFSSTFEIFDKSKAI